MFSSTLRPPGITRQARVCVDVIQNASMCRQNRERDGCFVGRGRQCQTRESFLRTLQPRTRRPIASVQCDTSGAIPSTVSIWLL